MKALQLVETVGVQSTFPSLGEPRFRTAKLHVLQGQVPSWSSPGRASKALIHLPGAIQVLGWMGTTKEDFLKILQFMDCFAAAIRKHC